MLFNLLVLCLFWCVFTMSVVPVKMTAWGLIKFAFDDKGIAQNTKMTPKPQRTAMTALHALQHALKTHNLDALIVPSADPHMSEYLPEYYQGRAYFSGFTGSMGTLVVAKDFAHLWADSRYWVQAAEELAGTGIDLQKIVPNTPTHIAYLAQHLPANARVGIDGDVLSLTDFESMQQAFAVKNIVITTDDVVGMVWEGRPKLPQAPIYCHAPQFVDKSATEKLAQVRASMTDIADVHLLSSLDDIAWLTNLRGSDVPCNPVFLAHMLIGLDFATLYVDESKLDQQSKQVLSQAQIDTKPYATLKDDLAKLSGTLMVDPAKVAYGTVAHTKATLVKQVNPSTLLKAIKTNQELANIREAMVQDGAALCEFFARLEERLAAGETLNETDIDTMLLDARRTKPYFVGASFETIAGFGANGAIVHYSAKPDSAKTLAGDGLLLIDSGGQYQNGTTDITRMAGVGKVCDDAKRDVTYVLKAHIALARAVFVEGCNGGVLDMLARAPLWEQGLDYGHGTGHGVGYFLNVHEGPQSICHYSTTPNRTIKEGMVTSNEPGLYRTGKWGVRIENLVACVPAFETEFGSFLKFEDLTLCPIDTRLILVDLLNQDEKNWLNAYHQKVRNALLEHVSGAAKDWLLARTQAL